VVMGESYENFKEIVGAMREAGAIRIVNRKRLGGALVELLLDREAAKAMGEQGRAMFEAQAGATQRTAGVLLELVEGGR
jgi:3-deoxy-D-manno-octulosonic-acid transferase